MTRVVFMGSPAFAVPCLRALAAAHDVALVVSQPDKPAGRGGQLTAPPVKEAALELGLPIIQPKSARNGELRAALLASGAELAAVVAYGKILPADVLGALPRGCLNVHGSLLPKYRGAAPIQRAVMNGDTVTGVSIMQLDEGMDTGPVLLERRVEIGPDETSGELFERLAPLGAATLLEAISQLDTIVPAKQDDALATHAPMLEKTDGAIDFTRSPTAVAALIRGVDPWPGAFALHRGNPLKLFQPRLLSGSGATNVAYAYSGARVPGLVVAITPAGMVVGCGDGDVLIREVQAAGRKRMAAAQFAAGRGIAVGDVLAP